MSQKQKLPRGKRGTYTRVVSRTTSESLRLVEAEKVNSDSTEPNTYSNLTLHSLQPKPASSFVVTSVVHSPRVDGGTESPEDESRSDDISRVTDLETPSCSEETYSKDVDEELSCFVSAQHFELTQPLVPFEDQMAAKNEEYVSSTDVPSPAPLTTIPSNDIPSDGFVTISPADETADSVIFTDDVQAVAPVTEPAAPPPEKIKHKRIRKPMEEFPVTVKKSEEEVFAAKCNRLIGRFQVIKVESIVPFHRGRWTCHDYLDNSKHAPKDGWVFHNGRFILKDDFEKLNRTDSQELAEQNESSTSFAEGEQQNSIVTQVNQDQVGSTQIEQPCMDQGVETSSLVPIRQYVGANNPPGVQYQTTLDTMSISRNIQSSVSQHTIDQNFTTYAGQNVACGWAQSSQYGGGNYSINTQYQTSIDSAPTMTMVQTITQNTVLQRRASDDLHYTSNANEHRAGLPAQYETSMPTQMQSCFTQHTTLQGQLTEQSFPSTDQSAILHRQTSDNQNVANTSTWLPSQYQAAMPQQMQRLDEHTFTDNIGEHLSSAPTYQYIGQTHPTKLQYQLSVDSALMPQNNQYATFQTQTSVDQATIDYYQKTFDNAWSSPQYVGENHPPEQYQTSVGSNVQPTIEQSQTSVQDITSIAGSTYVPTCQYVHESPSTLQYETSFDSTLFAKEIEHSSTSACAPQSQFVGDGHSTQMQHHTIDSNRTNVEINQHALQYYASAQNDANQYVLPATVDSELQFKLPQMTQNINNASPNILETQTTSNVQYFGETSNVQQVNYDVNRLTTATSENLQFARPLVPVESSTLQQIPQTNIQANISHGNQGYNIGGQYSAADMDTPIIPPTLSHRESFDIQGSIANTPPQTPTSSTDKLLNSVPSQTTQIHTSVMQTPPQTPTNSVISQAESPLGAFPPVLPQVHPIQSPCMFSNVCYSTPFSFLPVVAYPTLVAADPGVSQSYPNIHYQRQRCNSVPTIKDRETREILEEVKSFLNRSDQNKQAASQENSDEYLVVIKKARSVPSEIHKLETENVIAYRAIERKESKISDVISLDESRESETSTNENVIRNTSTDATKDISVSSISAVDNSTNTDVDDKKNEILSIVQYCLNDICNNVLESIEKKVIEESQKDLSLKLQELFKKATVDKQKLKLSKSLDNETGRFVVGGERKAKRYVPPFSNLKSRGSSSTSSLSDTDCIKSMTFVNSTFEERQGSLSDDLISFEEDWFPEDPILKVDTTTSTTDLYTRNLPGSIAIPLDGANNSESSQMNLGLPDTAINLDSSMNASTPDTPSLDTETTTTVVAVSSATSPDIQTSEIIPFSPVAGDGTATTTPDVQTKDIVISSSYEEIYR